MKKYWIGTMNEWKKLLARKKYLVLLLIGVAISLVNILGKVLLNRVSKGSVNLGGSNAAMAMMTLFIEFLTPLVSMMAVCDLFATEIQDGTLKAALLRPISRFKIYAAKISAVTLLALCYLLILCVTALGMDFLISGQRQNILYPLGAYLLDIVPLFVVILMAACINQFGKSSTMAMFSCIIIYILLYVAGIFIPHLSGLLFTGYMKWHTLWLGYTLPFGAISAKVAILAGYGLIFFSGGYYLFLKREV